MSVLVAVHRVFTASCEIFGYSVGAQWSRLRPSCSTTWGILIPWTGIEPTFLHATRWICNHWTTGKSLLIAFLVLFILSRGTAFFFLNLAALSLNCDMWDLVPRPGIKPGPPTLGAWSLATGPPGKPLLAFLGPLDLALTLPHEHLGTCLLVASVVSLSLGFSLFPCRLAGPSLTWVPCTEPWTLLEGRHGLGHTQMRSLSSSELGFSGGERYFFSHCLPQGRSTKRKVTSKQFSEDATSPASLQNCNLEKALLQYYSDLHSW